MGTALAIIGGIAFLALYIWGWVKLYRDNHQPTLSDEEMLAKINEIEDESVRKYYLAMFEMQRKSRPPEQNEK